MAFNRGFRAPAMEGRGLAAQLALDKEMIGKAPLPSSVGFSDPFAIPRAKPVEPVIPEKPAWMREEEEVAQTSEDNRTSAENWIKAGGSVAGGVLGGILAAPLGPMGIAAGAAAGSAVGGSLAGGGVSIGRSINPGAVDDLKEKRGEEGPGGKRALEAVGGSVQLLQGGSSLANQADQYGQNLDSQAVLDRQTMLIANEQPGFMDEVDYLDTRQGRNAYISTDEGDGNYGASPTYKTAYGKWLNRQSDRG